MDFLSLDLLPIGAVFFRRAVAVVWGEGGACSSLQWLVAIASVVGATGWLLAIGLWQERQQLREVAREQNAYVDRLCDRLGVGQYRTDAEGYFLQVSSHFGALVGYSETELQGMTYRDIVHPDDLAAATAAWAEVQRGETAASFELRYLGKDGKTVWGKLALSPASETTGDRTETQVLATVVNITPRKQAEARYRLLFDSCSDAIFVHPLAENGIMTHFVEVNDSACQSLGYTRAELLQLTPRDILPPEYQPDPDTIAGFMATGAVAFLAEHVTKSGDRFPVEGRATKILLDGVPSVLSVVRDLRDRQRLEEVRQQQIERERLIGAIAQRVRETLQLQAILDTTVTEVRQFLAVDCVAICQFAPDGSAIVAASSPFALALPDDCPSALCCLPSSQGGIAIADLAAVDPQAAGLDPQAIALLNALNARAYLALPIACDGELWGMLIAKHDREPRPWLESERQLLQQLIVQVAIAIRQAYLYEAMQTELTDRMEAERALAANQRFLDTILNAAPEPLYVKDRQHRWVKLNEAFCQLYGHSCDEIQAADPAAAPAWVQQLRRDDEAAFCTGCDRPTEDTIVDAAGNERVVSIRRSLVTTADGQQLLIGIMRDITELKQVQDNLLVLNADLERRVRERTMELRDRNAQLQELNYRLIHTIAEQQLTADRLEASEARNRAFLDALPDLLLRIDSEGALLDVRAKDWNPLTFSPDRFHGHTIRDACLFEPHVQVERAIATALATGIPQSVECTLDLPAGKQYLEARFAVSGDREVLAIVRDVSDREAAHANRLALERERELSKLQRNFFSMVSHEFRTPLNVIRMAAQQLELSRAEMFAPKDLQKLARIREQVDLTVTLLDEITNIYHAEAAQLDCDPHAFDLVMLCRNLIETLQPNPESRRVEFTSPAKQLRAYVDRRLLHSMLSNLISNALKYSDRNSPVSLHVDIVAASHLSAHLEGYLLADPVPTEIARWLVFQVRDRGVGIPPQALARIFDPFYRAQNVETLPGSGLGLTVVRKYALVHGGCIAARNNDPPPGTTFCLLLPHQTKQSKPRKRD